VLGRLGTRFELLIGFINNFSSRNYNYLLHYCAFTQFPITTRQSFQSICYSLHHTLYIFTYSRFLYSPGLRLTWMTLHSLRNFATENLKSRSKQKLLYDWRFTANQFVLASGPLRPTTRDFFFHLNSCGNSSYVTSSLRRRWVQSESESLYDWQSVSLSVLVSSPVWGSWPDI
jgi:hypothetical protein